MQVSKSQLNPELDKQIRNMLAQVLADIRNPEQALNFINDFFTQTEQIALSKRLAVILYLEKGWSYEDIKADIKVSSATIASVQKLLEKKSEGINLALRFIKAEEWASKWAGKISGFFGKK